MNRLLVCICCLFALLTLGYTSTRASETRGEALQDQKEVRNLDAYVGQYEVKPGFNLTVTHENNKLMGQPTGDAKIEFKADVEADKFSSAQENVQLKFIRDESGAVKSVIVTFDGNSFPSRKIK